jgi:hypothetical protein
VAAMVDDVPASVHANTFLNCIFGGS